MLILGFIIVILPRMAGSILRSGRADFRRVMSRTFPRWACSLRYLKTPCGCLAFLALATFCAPPILSGAAPAPDPKQTRLALADNLYQERSDLSKARQGLQLLHDVVSEDPNSYDAWWRLARLDNFVGRQQDDKNDDKEAIRTFEAGVDAGRRAVGLQRGRVEGHFWLGANYGLLAEEQGWIKGLQLIDSVRVEMETVIRLDPNYEEAAGQRTLARLYYRAPFFKGGNKQRSIQLLQDCLRRFPTDSFSLLYLGDDYLAVGRRDEARRLYERILSLGIDPIYGPELAENQAEARRRLEHEFRSGK
jgi:tetratricopeptide (TPR) repeat protein